MNPDGDVFQMLAHNAVSLRLNSIIEKKKMNPDNTEDDDDKVEVTKY